MRNQESNHSDWPVYAAQSEPTASPAQQRVRAALLSLPKETCPVGFEFRLMKRLAGHETKHEKRMTGWTLGWAGAGLGLAVAVFVSFAAFDFNVAATDSGVIAKSAQETQLSPATDQPEQLVVEKSTTITRGEETGVVDEPVQLAATPEDSAAKVRRGEIPAGLDQTVSSKRSGK